MIHILLVLSQMWYYFFTITCGVCNIRIFHLANKVCSLVSTWIKPIHISLFLGYFRINTCFHILGALVGFMPFAESFVEEALQKDLDIIVSFPILAYPHATFRLFIAYIFLSKYLATLCQVWFVYHGYIRKVIEAHGILIWHYGGSFGSSSSHFTCFFRGVWPSFSVLTCHSYFLGMLGFNAYAFVTHFQWDDHPILFYAIAHVDTNIFPFHLTLQDNQALLS